VSSSLPHIDRKTDNIFGDEVREADVRISPLNMAHIV
jgi:hypothetical protein